MVFIFPMLGRSSRFAAAGYNIPKYSLDLHGLKVFDWVLESFRCYFQNALFIFPHRDEPGVADFVHKRVVGLGISHAKALPIAGETLGQADTVLIALEALGLTSYDQPLLIFNIDSFRPRFVLPAFATNTAGYLEVFRGEGEGWSFVEPEQIGDHRVRRTTEKIRISDLCCTGLYIFSKAALFVDYARSIKASGIWLNHAKEFYVAPIYNNLIADGLHVNYGVVANEQVQFCGVPAEYEALKAGEGGSFRALFDCSAVN